MAVAATTLLMAQRMEAPALAEVQVVSHRTLPASVRAATERAATVAVAVALLLTAPHPTVSHMEKVEMEEVVQSFCATHH